jgi:hypothetical protein
MKSRRLRYVVHITRMGQKKSMQNLVAKAEKKRPNETHR